MQNRICQMSVTPATTLLLLALCHPNFAFSKPLGCEPSCPQDAVIENEKCGFDTNGLACASPPPCSGESGNCCAATGNPGCEDKACQVAVCGYDPFCCEEYWDSICAAEACAEPTCQCAPVEATIAGGQTLCGTQWAEAGMRDIDAFTFVSKGEKITWLVQASSPTQCVIVTGCPPTLIAAGNGDCVAGAVAIAILDPGEYKLLVMPAMFNGLPCDSGLNDYVASLTSDSCFTDLDQSGATNVDDLLIVLNGWGPCEKAPCASDVDLNDVTNVDDLLHVINRWGDCL